MGCVNILYKRVCLLTNKINFYHVFGVRVYIKKGIRLSIVAIALQGFLAFMFLIAGLGKVSGANMHVENFKKWGLPQWFRVVTGIVELVGPIALIIGFWEPSWAAAGGLLLGITAIGGILTHMRIKDSFKQTFMILLLGILAFSLFIIRLSSLSDFPGFK